MANTNKPIKSLKRTLFIIVFLLSVSNLQGQEKLPNEVGFDFIPSMDWSENRKFQATFFYNKWTSHNQSKRMRLEIDVPISITPSWDSAKMTGIDFLVSNYQYNNSKVFLKYGWAKYFGNQTVQFYRGIDINIGYAYKKNEHFYNESAGDPRNFTTLNVSGLIGVSPFIGGKIRISKYWAFTIEAGIDLNYMYERLPFYDSEIMTYAHRSSFVTSWGDRLFINDIAFSYRF